MFSSISCLPAPKNTSARSAYGLLQEGIHNKLFELDLERLTPAPVFRIKDPFQFWNNASHIPGDCETTLPSKVLGPFPVTAKFSGQTDTPHMETETTCCHAFSERVIQAYTFLSGGK